jgi:hypothetical protein
MLPLPVPLPDEFKLLEEIPIKSGTMAFRTGIDQRNVFDGTPCCVVCGIKGEDGVVLHHCHIIPRVDTEMVCNHIFSICGVIDLSQWMVLKENNYILSDARSINHEPQNGILLCLNHHILFDAHSFYICYSSQVCVYITQSSSCLHNHSTSTSTASTSLSMLATVIY